MRPASVAWPPTSPVPERRSSIGTAARAASGNFLFSVPKNVKNSD